MSPYVPNPFFRSASPVALAFILLCGCGDKKFRDEIYARPAVDPSPDLVALSPTESMQKIYLPGGYRIELVASEPMIDEPVSISWDGNGKMYVAQMNTYMQDADGTNENEPRSRIMRLEDTDGDGAMDKSSVFLDSVVLPRIVLPLDDRVIVGETYDRSLYLYRDANGDGVADDKRLLLEDTVRDNRNLEHQDATMLWNLDNWLYVTNKSFRYRFSGDQLIRDTLAEPMAGQWGVTQDETGRIFLSRAGTEIPAMGFQQHPVYGSLELEGRWPEDFLEPWPVVGTPDAQGGPKRIRPGDSTLNRFTGVSGQEVYLGDKMPGAYGDLFIPEPVGRLVRRAAVRHTNGKITLENRYDKAEFLASADPLFRPVYAATGPDGCLYIVDMYRGIIQEGNWVRKGSYLRSVVDRHGHDRYVRRGRIYRIYHENMRPDAQPRMLDMSAEELVKYLGHPNGWWRMTAQKLIVLGNSTGVIDELKDIIADRDSWWPSLFKPKNDPGVGRLHALWTLDGLSALDKPTLLAALSDPDERVVNAAVRLCEPFIRQNDGETMERLNALAAEASAETAQQIILSARSNIPATRELVSRLTRSFEGNEVIRATAAENLNPYQQEIESIRRRYVLRTGDATHQILNGYKLFQSTCAACHGRDGKGVGDLAPPLVGSPRLKGDPRTTIRILLHGLTGPLDGREYAQPMAPVADFSDEELADLVSYVREHLNGSGTLWRGEVRKLRERYKERSGYWTIGELMAEEKKDRRNL